VEAKTKLAENFAKKKNVEISQEQLAKFGYRSVEESRKEFRILLYIHWLAGTYCLNIGNFRILFLSSSGKKFTKRKECCVS
jgi:hypothetical protein